MLEIICRSLYKGIYSRMISNREKIIAYKSNLGTWETRLNDETRMLINSIKGSVDAEKFINTSGKINIAGFLSYIKQRYPKFYNSEMFKKYNNQVIHLQSKIRHEKEIINRYIRYFNEDIYKHPILSNIWNFYIVEYDIWNKGKNIENVSKEYNTLNKVEFK